MLTDIVIPEGVTKIGAAGIPGLVFVTGPGDDGGRDNRAGGTIKQGEDLELKFRKESKEPIYVQVWYPDEDHVEFSVRTL